MPIMYVNPAPKKRSTRKRKPAKRKATRRATPARRKNPKRKVTTMAKTKRRKAPVRRRRRKVAVKRKRRNPTSKAKRSAAARKVARTHAANKRSAAAKRRRKPTTRRRRRNPVAAMRRRRRRPAAKKAVRRRNPRKRSPVKRRRSAKRRRNPMAARRYSTARRRRRNPSRRRRNTHRRRNPDSGSLMDLFMKSVIPVAGSLYVSRLISGRLAGKIPGLDRVPEHFRSPVLAAALLAGGHYLTGKKGPVKMLQKHRTGIMTGLGINFLDKVIGAFAPSHIKTMFGISNYGEDIYGPALDDYVSVDDYVAVGNAPPIQDDITLSDYVAVGQYGGEGLEEELGQDIYQDLGQDIYQDLGVEMDLGTTMAEPLGFADRRLGGVHRNQMRAPIGHKRYTAPVPARSFTKQVPQFGDQFDASDRLYTGIFGGGYGC